MIILAAGLGTRLKPETDYIPKALVQIGSLRAIDYLIRKYQHIAEKFIVAVGYGADLLENYVKGKYPSLNVCFSREDVSELRGPGCSLVFALDCASSRLPTLVTFCDYLIGEYVPVDEDILGICKPTVENVSVLGEYASVVVAEEGVVTSLVRNKNPLKFKDFGFTGIGVFHDTLLLKMFAYQAAVKYERRTRTIDYTFDIVRPYAWKMKVKAYPISEILEFGTEGTLRETRRIIVGSNGVSSE